jgi:hypothetical protein
VCPQCGADRSIEEHKRFCPINTLAPIRNTPLALALKTSKKVVADLRLNKISGVSA